MKVLVILIVMSLISIFIPHKSTKYNFSWYSRLLLTITFIYVVGYWLLKIIELIN
jgi:hypothetical protein